MSISLYFLIHTKIVLDMEEEKRESFSSILDIKNEILEQNFYNLYIVKNFSLYFWQMKNCILDSNQTNFNFINVFIFWRIELYTIFISKWSCWIRIHSWTISSRKTNGIYFIHIIRTQIPQRERKKVHLKRCPVWWQNIEIFYCTNSMVYPLAHKKLNGIVFFTPFHVFRYLADVSIVHLKK